ncbi:MAG: DUF4282 domain-containing protein [Zhaonellaceae bacterium]|nr:DUF4282 domain-containing protein [Clostridia bacterium]
MQDFIQALFDFSFKDFITKRLISVLYGIGVGILGLASLFLVFSDFSIGSLLGGLIFFAVATISLRIWLEVIIILFAIEENTRGLRKLKTEEQDQLHQQ